MFLLRGLNARPVCTATHARRCLGASRAMARAAPLRANRNGASNASVGRRPASGGAAGAHRVVAEQYAVPLELARSTFQERFPSGSTKLDLRVTECGRGLVATAPIEEGEVLLSVPWDETIHVTEDGYDDPDDVRLAMELLHVLNHGGDGDEDPRVPVWARYRPMLPTSTGAAAFWRPENIRELQFEEAVDKTSELSMKFNEYALRHADQNNPTEDITWALAMVHSRSFSVCTPTGRARVLVPYADLFNHRPESPAEARRTDEALQRALAAAVEVDGIQDAGSEPWRVTGLDTPESESGGSFQMRSIWSYEPGEEVFITYGHETSAELLSSYGFFPEPNAGDFVTVYRDVQELLDDDRWVEDHSPGLAMEKESVMWNMLAVEAPLAVRPGGVSAAAHLLGCLRLMHAQGSILGDLCDRDVPHIGHSTFVWSEGAPCGLWDAGRVSAREEEEEGRGAVLTLDSAAEMRAAVDAAAMGQAAARCLEILDDFPTTIEEDEEMLRELEFAFASEQDEDAECDPGPEEYATALRYRLTVKRMLADFVVECESMGVPPSEW